MDSVTWFDLHRLKPVFLKNDEGETFEDMEVMIIINLKGSYKGVKSVFDFSGGN